MEIKQATIENIEALIENRMAFIYSLKNIMPSQEFKKRNYDYLEKHLQNETLKAWIAVENDKVISCCMLCISEWIPTPLNKTGVVGSLFNVYTIPEYRNQGLATALLKKVLTYAVENEIGAITLSATEQGASIYKQLGFQMQDREMIWHAKTCMYSK